MPPRNPNVMRNLQAKVTVIEKALHEQNKIIKKANRQILVLRRQVSRQMRLLRRNKQRLPQHDRTARVLVSGLFDGFSWASNNPQTAAGLGTAAVILAGGNPLTLALRLGYNVVSTVLVAMLPTFGPPAIAPAPGRWMWPFRGFRG